MWVLFIVIAVALLITVIGLYNKNTNAICKSKKHLSGKTVLVTGGTSGIGLQVALDLAHRDAKVIIACPFEDEGERAKNLIVEKTGNTKIVFKILDLSSLKSVRCFVKDILDNEERLDILFNHAGVGLLGDFLTSDGINYILQVNYFGHFLLTILLLPLLKKTGSSLEPARIVNTSSILHWIGKFDAINLNKTGRWFQIRLYGNSKLFFNLISHEMTKKLKESNVVINCADPGLVGTNIYDCTGRIFGFIIALMLANIFKNSWEGAQTLLYVALSRTAGQTSGKHFKNCRLSKTAPWACDDEASAKLWEESVRLVKLSDVEMK